MDELSRLSEVARARGLTVCVAESLTSGRLANTVGAGHDAADWFAGGVVAYRTEIKERVLGVVAGTDPCSASCAEQLALGALELFDADACVSTTGVGGPGPEVGHPPGTVYLGWATRQASGHRALALRGDPSAIIEQATEAATRLLLFHLEGLRAPGPLRAGAQPGTTPIRSGAPGADAASSASSSSLSGRTSPTASANG